VVVYGITTIDKHTGRMSRDNQTTNLHHFISKQMRMAQVYQPVMIKTLLANGGAVASLDGQGSGVGW